jgi:hypothetical protein
MKIIKFRPLRKNKKTGKIIVASYMQWRKIKTADYNKFILEINDEYKSFQKDELVYDHKGENLFWYNHTDPEALQKNIVTVDDVVRVLGVDRNCLEGEEYKISQPIGKGFHWSVRGFDCDGVPVFSHNSTNYVATHYNDITKFEPLTVGMVTKWFGWFLYQLENSRLQIEK